VRVSSGFPVWLGAQLLMIVPQAMAPIAFALATVGASGDVGIGAAMMAAMTGCQIVFAFPLSRWGRSRPPVDFLRLLIIGRGSAFGLVAAAQLLGGNPIVLVTMAGLAGMANGAIFGVFRTLLSEIIGAGQLPRAIALTATAAETVFVIGPVLAAVLGDVSGALPLFVMAGCALIPATLLRLLPPVTAPGFAIGRAGPISRALPIWLLCALAGSSAVACVETGAVAMALRFDRSASFGAVFAVILCLASVTGGAIITWANRSLPIVVVIGLLTIMLTGSLGLGLSPHVPGALAGTVLIGLCMAPVSTYYSIVIEQLVAPDRRSEAFSVLRAAQGSGVVLSALLLTVLPIERVCLVAAGLLTIAIGTVTATRPFLETQRAQFLISLKV
jgi:DHA1 family inner membrane transport protein